jgi:phosphate transport system ATP-binding protein
MDGKDIRDPDIDPPEFRRRFGWVAQKPNPFPSTIYENVAYGAGIHGLVSNRADMDAQVERCLRKADLWDEVKDKLQESGFSLSGGQQQRVAIARALANEPKMILADEPTGNLDTKTSSEIISLLKKLNEDKKITLIIITHDEDIAKQADRIIYMKDGKVRKS